MFKYLFFDLDGTVTDSAEGILNSVAYALNKLGISVEDKSTLLPFVGPPLTDSFKSIYGFDDEKSQLGVKYYREYYSDKGIFENKVYSGIENMLINLRSKGKKIILATSKPQNYAEIILDHFGISKYFDIIAGSTFDCSRRTKTDVLNYAIEQIGMTDYSQGIMIGDRKHDIIGAKEVGIKCIAVMYGYGNRNEFQTYGADYIIDDVEQLEIFLSDNV